MERRPVVGVMGSGHDPHEELAVPVGKWLAKRGVHLLNGGGGGVMTSVSKAFSETEGRRGLVIGVIRSGSDDVNAARRGEANQWVEIPIFTHLPYSGRRGKDPLSRNHINALASDVVIVLPGTEGTISEAELALDHYHRPAIGYLGSHVMSGLPSGLPLAKTFAELTEYVDAKLAVWKA